MSYVVYVNHPTSKARIHKVICPEYIYRKPDTRNGYWSRVFSTYQEAFNFAIGTGKKNVNSCLKCCSNQSCEEELLRKNS